MENTPLSKYSNILRACRDDPLQFVVWAFPWDSEASIQQVKMPSEWQEHFGCEYGPDKWVIDFFLNKVMTGLDAGTYPLQFSTASGHGIGKAQDINTLAATPNGWTKIGDLAVGDYVIGRDGRPTSVQYVSPLQQRKTYELTFDTGQKIVACSEHLWHTRQSRGDGPKMHERVRTTQEIVDSLYRNNGKAGLIANHSIPAAEALKLPEADLPVPPYTMGAWLGDGSTEAGIITNHSSDSFIVDRIMEEGYSIRRRTKNLNTVSVYGLQPGLKVIGVFGNKHIPDIYKRASYEQRLALIQGLIDTDGHVNKAGTVTLDLSHERLSKDATEVVRSLGIKVKNPRERKSTLYGVEKKNRWRIAFQPGLVPVTTLPRKAARQRVVQDDRVNWHFITEAKEVDPVPMRCIQVDASDKLFLVGENFIPTHNTTLVAWLILWIMSTRPMANGVVTANTAEQLNSKTWSELKKWLDMSKVKDAFHYSIGRGNMSLRHKQYPQRWKCIAQASREENSQAFAGLHAADSTPFYVFDEASEIPDKIFEVRDWGVTDGEAMVFDFGNPTRNTGRFYENMAGRFSSRYVKTFVDSREVAITNKELIAQRVEDFGEDSDYIKVRVRGMFPDKGFQQFMDSHEVDMASRRDLVEDMDAPLVIGVDVARFGDDKTVIYPRMGKNARTLPIIELSGMDTVQTTGRVVELIREFESLGKRVSGLFVDGNGLGGGVVDQLRHLGYQATEVLAQHRCIHPERYRYKSDEDWGTLREAIRNGLCLPVRSTPLGQQLFTELTGREYDFTLKGQIALESKRDLKERGMDSPNLADALSLTYSHPVRPTRSTELDGRGRLPNYNPWQDRSRKAGLRSILWELTCAHQPFQA